MGGVVAAAERVLAGEIKRAFVFIGAGGHHAGRDFFGGYCCFNDVVIAIAHLRDSYSARKLQGLSENSIDTPS